MINNLSKISDAYVLQDIDALTKLLNTEYLSYWNDMISGIKDPRLQECFFLLAPSSYVFKTSGVLWAYDIGYHNKNMFNQVKYTIENDLEDLSFMLISHRHVDHFDVDVINKLASTAVKLLVPHFMKDIFLDKTKFPKKNIIWMGDNEQITLDGITIKSFPSLHWSKDRKNGVDSLGYYVQSSEKKILLPSDIRVYESEKLPDFEDIDCLFAHVWLGRAKALEGYEEYISEFSDFMSSFKSRQMFLTHLYDTDRPLTDMWTFKHASMLKEHMDALKESKTDIIIPKIGDCIKI